MSFSKYAALEIAQNVAAARTTSVVRCQSNTLWEKIKAAKTNPFFTHWAGRRASTKVPRVELAV
jgi:hypothetical protein